MEIAIVAVLILANGLLSMSEFAVVSSQRTRLQQRADTGKPGASAALELADNPNRFLSTVQVGITLVGILVGTFGGAAIADDLAIALENTIIPDEHVWSVALIIVVGSTTYLTLVIGELVPKQLAIRHPEQIASWISGPMKLLAAITWPLVWFLSVSSSTVLRALGQKEEKADSVSEEEVKLLLRQGEERGVFRRAETQMVAGVFRLDDIRADALMTPRVDVAWLEASSDRERVLATISQSDHSRYPVCDGTIDRVVGVVEARAIAAALLSGDPLDLRELARPAEVVPESADAGTLVDRVADTGRKFMVVVSEHGGVDGVVTTHDLAEAVLGDLGKPEAKRLPDGSWQIAGSMPIEEVEALLDVHGLRDASAKSYGTIAGFVMNHLGRVANGGEEVRWGDLVFTVERVVRHRIRMVKVYREENSEEKEPAR
jgi:putative hemolysin